MGSFELADNGRGNMDWPAAGHENTGPIMAVGTWTGIKMTKIDSTG
jgi:hypothetical protein